MNDTMTHEYETPALYELGEAKELTKGAGGEDKMDFIIGGWRVVPGSIQPESDE